VNGSSARQELERLRDAVADLIGFGFEEDRLEQLGVAVRARVTELGLAGLDAYVDRLRAPEHRVKELPVIAGLVTVTETYFHRNFDQVSAFLEAVAEERHLGSRRLRVLSAGCASGEEPYTLAIALREQFPDIDTWDLQILAVDVNPAMLEKARVGRYTPWSLRAVPDLIKGRYFKRSGNDFQLSPVIMNMVEFREQNIAERNVWPFDSSFADVIFCRNVIMYFAPDVMRNVVVRLTQSLVPGGCLFLGHAETLRGLSHDYHLCHTHGTFYYQKKSREEVATQYKVSRPVAEEEHDPWPSVELESASWFDAIQAASRRVTEIADAHDSVPKPTSAQKEMPRSPAPRPKRLADVLELMRGEHFAEALALLEGMPAETSAHPDALLLSAVLLTNHGKIDLAELACEKLLSTDDLNAGAHYLKGLCREHVGDDTGALEHDRIAAHLDPTFAMPRLHAGLLAKRTGDRPAARRELSQALVLLEREDTSRLVLFGGGFSRDMLTTLCRNELSRLGEGVR
jgi:chemotaxis protein methyltransferase CheR